jgi:hypothetical protein
MWKQHIVVCFKRLYIWQLFSGRKPVIFLQKVPVKETFQPFSVLLQTIRRLFKLDKSPPKKPSHHFFVVNRVDKTSNIIGKVLLSLQPIARTPHYYKRVDLKKRQTYFRGLAMYGREVYN